MCFRIACFAVRLPRSDKLAFMSANREEEPSESLEEMEAQTIGNLLPDEDDLFAEVVGEVGYKSRANAGDELDDCDLFSSVGGMELDGDVFSSVGHRDGKRGSNVSVVGEPPRGEILSRILFVRNMDSIIEDYELRVLFEVCFWLQIPSLWQDMVFRTFGSIPFSLMIYLLV